jgi:hypothetical protein
VVFFSFDPALPFLKERCHVRVLGHRCRQKPGTLTCAFVHSLLVFSALLAALNSFLFVYNIWTTLKKQLPASMFRIVTILLESQ